MTLTSHRIHSVLYLTLHLNLVTWLFSRVLSLQSQIVTFFLLSGFYSLWLPPFPQPSSPRFSRYDYRVIPVWLPSGFLVNPNDPQILARRTHQVLSSLPIDYQQLQFLIPAATTPRFPSSKKLFSRMNGPLSVQTAWIVTFQRTTFEPVPMDHAFDKA